MLKEGESYRGKLKEKGKTVFKRVTIPAIQATAAIGAIVGATDMVVNVRNTNEIDGQINTQVSQAYPRIVSEEQYKLAKREIAIFDKDFYRRPHQFINTSTLSMEIPKNVADDINLIARENTRSENATALKSQLEDQYNSVDEDRTRRGLLILALSMFTYSIPNMARLGVSKFRKFRGAPSSPKPTNS